MTCVAIIGTGFIDALFYNSVFVTSTLQGSALVDNSEQQAEALRDQFQLECKVM
ncbi:hypothetical protein [Paenibacillus peoriae]|uniref:hypothetical protein n=1 Tax=Paenibacillus peoriae TaxID=59893 RepID=UPI0015E2DE74|nr:hypothetical protein [Paenibacillus peoriae]